jgi:hypothetical protein
LKHFSFFALPDTRRKSRVKIHHSARERDIRMANTLSGAETIKASSRALRGSIAEEIAIPESRGGLSEGAYTRGADPRNPSGIRVQRYPGLSGGSAQPTWQA